jgi:hypothetical protein
MDHVQMTTFMWRKDNERKETGTQENKQHLPYPKLY